LAKSERRLGKGLGALLGEYVDEEVEPEGPVRELPLSRIRPNPYQPRSEFGEKDLEQLVESIRENGLLQPLVVRPADDGEWEIVAGERRYRALRELGRETAPVVVRELTDRQMLVLALVENLQRENLSPLEEARGFRQLMRDFELTQAEVAERVGRDRTTVANTMRLLRLPEPVRELVEDGALSEGHARAILGLEDEEDRVEMAREVVGRELSVRETERRVRQIREAADAADGEEGEAEEPEEDDEARRSRAVVDRTERVLGRALGTEVSVDLDGSESGEFRIPFHDSADFERLVVLMGGDEADDLFDPPPGDSSKG